MGKSKSAKTSSKRLWKYSWAVVDANISDPILRSLAALLKSAKERRTAANSASGELLENSPVRNVYVIGLRSSLRYLEQGKLAVVLFNHENWPAYFCYHIGIVSERACAHCSQVKNLSAAIAPVVGSRSVRALGIKKSFTAELRPVVDQVKYQLPHISVMESNFLTYFE